MYEMNYTCDEKNFSWYFSLSRCCLSFLVTLRWGNGISDIACTDRNKNRDSLRWVMKFSSQIECEHSNGKFSSSICMLSSKIGKFMLSLLQNLFMKIVMILLWGKHLEENSMEIKYCSNIEYLSSTNIIIKFSARRCSQGWYINRKMIIS